MIIEASSLFSFFPLPACSLFHILTYSNYVIYGRDNGMSCMWLAASVFLWRSCRVVWVVGVELVSHQTGLVFQLVLFPILMPLDIFICQIYRSCGASNNILNLFCSLLASMLVSGVQRHKQSVCMELPRLIMSCIWPVCAEDNCWWTKEPF